jgi:hypothetical protein
MFISGISKLCSHFALQSREPNWGCGQVSAAAKTNSGGAVSHMSRLGNLAYLGIRFA